MAAMRLTTAHGTPFRPKRRILWTASTSTVARSEPSQGRGQARPKHGQHQKNGNRQKDERPLVAETIEVFLLGCVCQAGDVGEHCDAGDEQYRRQSLRCHGSRHDVNENATHPHKDGAQRIALVRPVIENDGAGERRTARGHARIAERHERETQAQHAKPGGKYHPRLDLARRNWAGRPFARIPFAIDASLRYIPAT